MVPISRNAANGDSVFHDSAYATVNGNTQNGGVSIAELAVNGFSSTLPQRAPVSQHTTGILLPLYIYPLVWILGNAYEQLGNIATAHPSVGITAIINPDSGPGTAQNIDYVEGISILKNAGIRVIGYTYTSYGSRPIADVEADIDRYISFYGSSISGVLFDEMAYTSGNENYYKTLSNYAKSKGLTFTAGNPGIDTLPSYLRLGHNSMFSFCQLLLIIWYIASLWVSNVLVKNDQIHPKKASRNKYFRIHLN
jgi:hypothetical protein